MNKPTTPEQAIDRIGELELALATKQIQDEIADLRAFLIREAQAAGFTIPQQHTGEGK